MAVLDLSQGQHVQIPAIQLTDGQPFSGLVRATQGDTAAIELAPATQGLIPSKIDGACVLTWKLDGIQHACPVTVRSKSSRAMVVQAVIQERREAHRLRAEVRLTYEVIPPEHVTEIAEKVMAHNSLHGEPVSESTRLLRTFDDPIDQVRKEIADLRAMMNLIVNRIDQLTQLVVSGEKPQSLYTIKTPIAINNCSSTGLGFMADEFYEQGQYLRLHLSLSSTPQIDFDAMGVVVRCNRLDPAATCPLPRYDTGVRFTHIHESDREHLIHYLFKVQRRMLRDMKDARDDLR